MDLLSILLLLIGFFLISVLLYLSLKLNKENKALRKKLGFNNKILKHHPDIIWLKDPNGHFLMCNKRFEEFYGADENSIIGKTDFDFLPKELASYYTKKDNEAISRGSTATTEIEVTFAKDGHKEILETIKKPLFNKKGKLIGVLGISRDVTEKNKNRIKISDSEKILQDVLNTIPVRVFWKDLRGQYLGCNYIFAKDAGKKTAEELITLTDFEMPWEEQAEKYRKDDKYVIETNTAKINYEELQTNYQGVTNWLNTSKVPLRNSRGEIYGVLGTYEDVTNRKRRELELNTAYKELKNTQEKLTENELKFRQLSEKAVVIIYKINLYPDRKIEYLNPIIEKITGYSPEEFYNDSNLSYNIVHKDDKEIFNQSQLEANDKPYVMRWIKKDGSTIWIEKQDVLITDNNRTEDYIIGSVIDITEIKQIQEELQIHKNNLEHLVTRRTKALQNTIKDLKNAQTQLIQSEKMASLGILTAGVAHEINNPLNYIMGGYVGLERYFETNKAVNNKNIPVLLSSIKLGVERATNIVKSLNQFSRQNEELNEKCNIHNIIDNSLLMIQSQLNHTVFTKKELIEQDVYIKGNVGKLHQLMLNILVNSKQAISNDGLITVSTSLLEDKVQIKISDNGCGIPKENLKKITDPFFTTKAPGKGTGLGLSISYNIVQQHKGELIIESDVNTGTTIKIIFPTI